MLLLCQVRLLVRDAGDLCRVMTKENHAPQHGKEQHTDSAQLGIERKLRSSTARETHPSLTQCDDWGGWREREASEARKKKKTKRKRKMKRSMKVMMEMKMQVEMKMKMSMKAVVMQMKINHVL